jgi:hypothetical protein
MVAAMFIAVGMAALMIILNTGASPCLSTVLLHQFGQSILAEKLNIFLQIFRLRLKNSESHHIQYLKQPVPDPTHNHAVQLSACESLEGIASGIRIGPVTVGYGIYFAGVGVNFEKKGC